MRAKIKWLISRVGFLKRIFIELFEKLIYQKESQFLLHSWNAHKAPFKSLLFYNFIGRVFFSSHSFLALLFKGRVFKKSFTLQGYDAKTLKTPQKPSSEILYPHSPLCLDTNYKLDDKYAKKIEHSLLLAKEFELKNFDKTTEWERIEEVIEKEFFDKNGKLIKENLVKFRSNPKKYQEIFNDEFAYIDLNEGYEKSYLKSIDLLLEYHRNASKIDKTLLASISESQAGENLCMLYRGKRLSHKILFHAMVVSDLIKIIPFRADKRDVVLDIGSGYGALSRLLYYYTPNSCHILLDLPDTLVLTSYYIKYNFPDAKIGLLADIVDKLDDFDTLTKEYDFIIIPPAVLESIKDVSVDVIINTASMGFMQKEYLDFYLSHIERVLKSGGYFYSLNKEYDDKWGIGMYGWNFKSNFITRLFEYNNRFSFPQWLGQKI